MARIDAMLCELPPDAAGRVVRWISDKYETIDPDTQWVPNGPRVAESGG